MNPVTDPDILAQLNGSSASPTPVTDPAVLAQLNGPQGTSADTTDLAKSAGIGLVRGGIGVLGLPGDVNSLIGKGVEYVGDKLGLPRPPENAPTPPNLNPPTSSAITNAIEGQTGKFYEPQTVAGQYARTAGEFVPAIIGGPESIGVKLLTRIAGPAIGSETAGQLTAGTPLEPWARVAGALVSPAAMSAGRRVITPVPSDPARQRLVDILQGEGVTSLTAGQRTGNKALQYAESVLGDALGAGSPVSRLQQEGQQQFTQAAMRRAGGGADASPETLDLNNQRLGNAFQTLSARNNLNFDPQFGQDITGAIRGYQRVPPSQQRAIVENYIQDISDHVANGSMPGAQYQEMRSRLSRQANGLRTSDPTLSDTLRNMRDALDGAMGRSISPADRQAWQDARREYGAQKTLETAASRAGAATAEGQIVPANLRNAVSVQNRGAYARGQGDFSELARAGSGIMAPLPQSGTGPRVTVQMLASMLGGGAGLAGGPAGAGLGAAAGAIAGPAVLGRALMSRPVQSYLGNQILQAAPRDNVRDAIVRAILAEQHQPLRITVHPRSDR